MLGAFTKNSDALGTVLKTKHALRGPVRDAQRTKLCVCAVLSTIVADVDIGRPLEGTH
jgi:hypothetical protein